MKSSMVVAAAALVAIALGVAGLLTLRAPQAIAFTQAQLQSRIDPLLNRELPLKGPAADLVASLEARAVAVTIAGGHVDVAFRIEGRPVVGPRFSLAATMRGAPRYDEGAFYFDPEEIRLVKFALGDGGDKLQGALAAGLALLAGQDAADLVADKAQDLQDAARELVQDALKTELGKRPIYRLPDGAKGDILRATLDSMAVEGDRLVLRFTLWRVTLWAALGAAALLGGLALLTLALRRAA